MGDNTCEQFILPENRYCDQEAIYHDEIRSQAYCEFHAAAWAKWRGDAERELNQDRQDKDDEYAAEMGERDKWDAYYDGIREESPCDCDFHRGMTTDRAWSTLP